MSKRNMEDHERAGMIESLQCNRPNEPTEFVRRTVAKNNCPAMRSRRLG
jgi:hypothetical protein